MATGNCRLDYNAFENRAFFLSLFRHSTNVAARGCWRTAFEFNKLLLSLSPDEDPLSVILSIDFYAYVLRPPTHVFPTSPVLSTSCLRPFNDTHSSPSPFFVLKKNPTLEANPSSMVTLTCSSVYDATVPMFSCNVLNTGFERANLDG